MRMARAWGGWILVLGMSGCAWPKMSPENSLPKLVVIAGQAMLPADYQIASDTQPVPRQFQLTLTRLDGRPIAVGTVMSDQGDFSINVPQDALATKPSLYPLQLHDSRGTSVLRGLVKLSSQTNRVSTVLNSASTALTLAAVQYARSGKDPGNWNVEALVKDAKLSAAALSYGHQLAVWSNATAGATASATPPAPSIDLIQKVIAIASAS